MTIMDDTRARFGDLSAPQLNWKPSADRWSVAQCFDHLVTANAAFFPIFEQVLNATRRSTVWERLPGMPAVWGRIVIKAVSPESTRKVRAPGIFQPSTSSIDAGIVRRFIDQQGQVLGYMTATRGMDLGKIIITSPVSRVITYSLIDAYTIMVYHEKRHLLQALRVVETTGFPSKSSQRPTQLRSAPWDETVRERV
jgi:hypothetical protein